jgi:zinc metalloprotease ZmpB
MRLRHFFAAGILLILGLIIAGGAQALKEPSREATSPVQTPAERYDATDPLDIVQDGYVNRQSGGLALLVNQNAGPFDGGAEVAARSFLAARAGAFALSRAGTDLGLDEVREAPAGLHARFHQTVNGIPVWAAEVIVALDGEGRMVRAVNSSYDPILAHATVPSVATLNEPRAREIAIAAVGIATDAHWLGQPKGDLWILREADRVGAPAHLAWREQLAVERPMGDWEVFVDANDGSVLRLRDQAAYVDGSGYTFDPDPLTTAQVNYGDTGYSDPSGNDADTAQLNAQRIVLPLRDITLISGLYNLRGPWVYLEDFESPVSAPVTNADPNGFMYLRSQQGFEDANCYAHIDMNQRYIQSLGFNTIQHGPIHADPHGLSGADNSHYIPSTNQIAWGEGGVDDAEDVDVLLHEYGHAIQNSTVPGWGGSTQERSMGEGFGDYWACSYSASLSSFHNDWVFNWDGHNPFWSGRFVNSTQGYSSLNNDIYHDGTIWASCWWLIRAEMGRTVSDTDVLKMHFYMNTTNTMPQAAAFAMQADKDLYGGLHSGTLDYYFTLRGFVTASQFDVPALTHTPLGDQTTGGPYPITVTIASTSAITANSVKVKFGTGTTFNQEVVLSPTGNANEWGGAIPGQGGNVDIRYYIQADNAATWRGAAPRGAEYQYYHFHVAQLNAVEDLGSNRTLALLPNEPNPFNPTTKVRFDLPSGGQVRLSVIDLQGRAVRTLADGALVAGRHAYVWDGRDEAGHALASGLYFVRLEAGGKTLSRKILMAK